MGLLASLTWRFHVCYSHHRREWNYRIIIYMVIRSIERCINFLGTWKGALRTATPLRHFFQKICIWENRSLWVSKVVIQIFSVFGSEDDNNQRWASFTCKGVASIIFLLPKQKSENNYECVTFSKSILVGFLYKLLASATTLWRGFPFRILFMK